MQRRVVSFCEGESILKRISPPHRRRRHEQPLAGRSCVADGESCWRAGRLAFPLAGMFRSTPARASERPKSQPRTGSAQERIGSEILGGSCLLESSIESFFRLGNSSPQLFVQKKGPAVYKEVSIDLFG